MVGPPGLEEYLRLRRDSGLTPKSAAQGTGALTASWSFCHVREQASDGAVAMGRVLGDGGWYFHIADMATLPEHQGRGIGRFVLEWLLADIAARAPADPYVTLLADEPGRRLYTSAGFVPTAPATIGMRLERPAARSASIRDLVRDTLTTAMRERDRVAIAAYRIALSALDNAAAVEPEAAPAPVQDGPIAGAAVGAYATEVPRRQLTEAEQRAIIATQSAQLRHEADDFAGAGRPADALRLWAQADLLQALLVR